MKLEQMEKVETIFEYLKIYYDKTGELVRAEFYNDDEFNSVTLYSIEPDDVPEGWDDWAFDIQLGLDEAITFLREKTNEET